jgi:hypothetical protein
MKIKERRSQKTMTEILDGVTLRDIIYFIVGFIGVLSVIVEKAKSLPFHPWTHLFQWIGRSLTSDVSKRLDELEKATKANNDAIIELEKKVEKKFEEKQKDDDEKEAKRLRASIISFADSCRCGNKHTQNHYENVMRDYDDYMAYCNKHGIPNHYIESEYKYIEELYHERLHKNDFL